MRYLLLLLLTATTMAQELSPPDGIHLVGSAAPITFRWPGTGQDFYLEITAGRATLFSGQVKGNSHTLILQPGPLYRWKVSEGRGGTYADTGGYHTFQFQANLDYSYDGAPGRPGFNGQQAGASGGPGGSGQPGQNVNVELQRLGDFIQVTLGPRGSLTRLWLVPGSAPLLVSACGGSGGPGGAGAYGLPGTSVPNQQTGYVYTQNGGPGGNGGAGGDGGNGGSVSVRAAPGLDLKALVRARVDGGAAGPGGIPGPGGEAAAQYYGLQANNLSLAGREGQAGASGRPGRPGTVSGL